MQTLDRPEGQTGEPVDGDVEAALGWVNGARATLGQEPLEAFPAAVEGLPQVGNPVAQALGCKVFRNHLPPLVWALTMDKQVADVLGLKRTYAGCAFEGRLPGVLWRFLDG